MFWRKWQGKRGKMKKEKGTCVEEKKRGKKEEKKEEGNMDEKKMKK